MNVNLKPETGQYCYVYGSYKIEKIKGIDYILPEENATKRIISITENIDDQLIVLLNIGKKACYYEHDVYEDIVNFVNRYGLLGFMSDLPINKFYILDEDVIYRNYNFEKSKSYTSIKKLEDYIKMFMIKLSKRDIAKIINECKKSIHSDDFKDIESDINLNINEELIYSKNYAESVDVIIYYARDLYRILLAVSEDKYNINFPNIANLHNLNTNMDNLSSREIKLEFSYLKQAIDFNFSQQLAQEVRLLKICNFCGKAFIANNPKAEYDTPQCKNKANVYKSRGKVISPKAIQTGEGIAVKIPSQELSDSIVKKLKKK